MRLDTDPNITFVAYFNNKKYYSTRTRRMRAKTFHLWTRIMCGVTVKVPYVSRKLLDFRTGSRKAEIQTEFI